MEASQAKESQSRRDFFRNVFKKTGEVALKEAESTVQEAARRFIRPPGAIFLAFLHSFHYFVYRNRGGKRFHFQNHCGGF